MEEESLDFSTLGIILEEDTTLNFSDISPILEQYHGEIPVYIFDKKSGRKYKADEKLWVCRNPKLLGEQEALLGENNIAVK